MSRKTEVAPKHIAQFIGGIQLTPIAQLRVMPAPDRANAAACGLKLELAGKLYAGFALMDLREEVGHGFYMAALRNAHINDRTARRCVAIARLSLRVPAESWPALANLDPGKLELMVSWEDDEIRAFCAGDEARGITLGEAQSSSLRELEQRIKESRDKVADLQREKQNLEARLALKEREVRQLHEQRIQHTQPYPEYVTLARSEANALAEKARLCLDDLAQIHADHLARYATQQGDPRAEEYWDTAAAAIYHNTRAVVAQATALIKRLEADLPPTITGEITGAYLYNDEDIAQAARDRELLVQLHAHERALRAQSRPQPKRGPGRPRKEQRK